jgi:hypothetical protein
MKVGGWGVGLPAWQLWPSLKLIPVSIKCHDGG